MSSALDARGTCVQLISIDGSSSERSDSLKTRKPAVATLASQNGRDEISSLTVSSPEKGVGALVSPPGTGKTTLLADIMFSIATQTSWFGHTVLMPGSCVYVAAEDPGGFKLRLRARKQAAGLPLDAPIGVYTFPEAIDMRDAASVSKFSDFLNHAFEEGDTPRRTLVIDTYAASTPGANENSSEDTTLTMSHAQRWRDELGISLLVAHPHP